MLASVVTCDDKALLPAVIMFEYEPAHWERFGHMSFGPTASSLTPKYLLFAIDYLSGELAPIGGIGQPVWTGRNILAIHRSRAGMLPLDVTSGDARL